MHHSLPAGWRVSNSSGSWSAPAKQDRHEIDNIADDEGLEPEDLRPDSPGWEDMEDDVEELSIKCLFCDERYSTFDLFDDHQIAVHQFDLRRACRKNCEYPSAQIPHSVT